jgi:arsenite transporter
MMYPILCKIKYETLHLVFAHRQIWIQIGFSIILNWIVAPLFMVSHVSIMLPRMLYTPYNHDLELSTSP